MVKGWTEDDALSGRVPKGVEVMLRIVEVGMSFRKECLSLGWYDPGESVESSSSSHQGLADIGDEYAVFICVLVNLGHLTQLCRITGHLIGVLSESYKDTRRGCSGTFVDPVDSDTCFWKELLF